MTKRSIQLSDALESYDEIAVGTASRFFRKHNMPQLEDRVIFGYASDFGGTRALKHVYMRVFDFNWLRFVRFYEKMFRRREVPHYEDALAVVTVTLSAVAAIGVFVSPIIGVE
jgi:hypothetical protein